VGFRVVYGFWGPSDPSFDRWVYDLFAHLWGW